jgi:hypothetical protein
MFEPRTASIAWKPHTLVHKSASVRLRSCLPCRYLQDAGWPCEIFEPRNIDSYKLVIFQKAYDPDSILLAEVLSARGVKILFDLSDNHFYIPDSLPFWHDRAERLGKMLDVADSVSVSTPELKKWVHHKDCVVIDDVVEAGRNDRIHSVAAGLRRSWTRLSQGNPLRVVWYGNAGSQNPPFGLVDLARILPHLEAVNARTPIELTVISNSEELFHAYLGNASFPMRYYEWSEDVFRRMFKCQDVCVIPVSANPFTVCKSNNRLVLSLLMGIPVIADVIPSYEEFQNFVLFSDWENSLLEYSDHALRRRHVSQAQRYIRSKYNRKRVVLQWSAVIERMLGNSLNPAALR